MKPSRTSTGDPEGESIDEHQAKIARLWSGFSAVAAQNPYAWSPEFRTPEEIASHFGFPLELVRDIALKVDRSEYKRKQAAPGIKITSRAFGFGRPFPIAQKFVP